MTRHERLMTCSDVVCCACERNLSVQELEEFCGTTDDELHSSPYCRSCLERHLRLCPECSGRYTARGVCGECREREDGNHEQETRSEEVEVWFGKTTSTLVTPRPTNCGLTGGRETRIEEVEVWLGDAPQHSLIPARPN